MKITLQHRHVRSTHRVDAMVERHIFALQKKVQIEEATVRLEHHRESSPPFWVGIFLTIPGPDLTAEAADYTLAAATHKVIAAITSKLDRLNQTKGPSRRINRQAPARVGQRRGVQ